MSLDDQFNPNDGSFIDTIDSALFNFNKKIATTWQNKTYKSKKDLEKYLYYGSALSFGGYSILSNFFSGPILVAFSTIKAIYPSMRPKSSKQDEINDESIGLPKKIRKYLNVSMYGMGIFSVGTGISSLVPAIIYGDNELYKSSLEGISLGFGLLSWITADYIAKSDIGNPPKKQ